MYNLFPSPPSMGQCVSPHPPVSVWQRNEVSGWAELKKMRKNRGSCREMEKWLGASWGSMRRSELKEEVEKEQSLFLCGWRLGHVWLEGRDKEMEPWDGSVTRGFLGASLSSVRLLLSQEKPRLKTHILQQGSGVGWVGAWQGVLDAQGDCPKNKNRMAQVCVGYRWHLTMPHICHPQVCGPVRGKAYALPANN